MDNVLLVRKAKDGDKDTLVELIMLKKNEYYKLAYVFMKNEQDALDAMQDMTLILYQNIHKLKNEESFYSWSKTILVNCCKNQLRKNKKILLLDEYKEGVYEEKFQNSDTSIILEKNLIKLNFKYQEVIKLRYYLDMDYESIAKLINVPVGTVKSRIFNGLKKLKESMGGEGEW